MIGKKKKSSGQSGQDGGAKAGVRKLSLVWKIVIGIVIVLFTAVVGVVVYANYLYGKMNVELPENIELQEETFEVDEEAKDLEEVSEEEVNFNDSDTLASDDEVINILLCGEEAIHSDPGRGRTDCIMIATLNQKDGALRLTSIMRDCYVQIEGHSNNKINAAYGIGGMPLLMKTVEDNFDVSLDGYILIGFDGFETLIDKLGGVDITLTGVEARYLNTHDYITHHANRNVQEGLNQMNGDQALGYARVRKVSNTTDGVSTDGDFGRTQRHRNVINAIFQKVKEKSLVDLLAMLPDLFSLVTTDLTRGQCIEYLTDIVNMGISTLETYRVPGDSGYTLSRVNTMSVVLINDFQQTNKELHSFIFGNSYTTVHNRKRHDTIAEQ